MSHDEMTNDQPVISVVIPVYNGEKTIAHAVDSVLKQSYPAHEIIVVNDGSVDRTDEIARSYNGSIIYIEQRNAGVSAARNTGVNAATGEWLAFLDCDDLFLPDRLLQLANVIKQDPNADCVVAGFDYRGENGKFIKTSMAKSLPLVKRLYKRAKNGIAWLEGENEKREFIENQFSDLRGFSVTRVLFDDVKGFPVGVQICEDVMFIIRCIIRSNCTGVICGSTAVYSVHDHGLIRSDVLRSQIGTIDALKSMAQEMKDATAPIRSGWRSLLKKSYQNLAYHYARAGQRSLALAAAVRGAIVKPRINDLRILGSLLLPVKRDN